MKNANLLVQEYFMKNLRFCAVTCNGNNLHGYILKESLITSLNISTAHRVMPGKNQTISNENCLTTDTVARREFKKTFYISYRLLKTQMHSVSIVGMF